MLTMLNASLRNAIAALNDRKGVTALEYGVLAAGIIAVIAAIIFTLGGQLNTMFNHVSSTI